HRATVCDRSGVALQSRLGLLSERRSRTGRLNSRHPAPDGPHLARPYSLDQLLREVCRIANRVRNPSSKPAEEPTPIHSGRAGCRRRVTDTFTSTGTAIARTGGHGRFSAKSDRAVISIRLQPIRLGPSPRNTA